MSDPSRREVLKVVGAGVAGAAVVAASVPRQVTSSPGASPVSDATPSAPPDATPAYLSDLTGQALGPYRVESVGALERGGIPIVLSTASGTRFRVDVLRVDPADGITGIGVASAVSVYLRNGGNGNTATNEEQGLGAMALAAELQRRARAGERPPSELLTRGERDALDSARV